MAQEWLHAVDGKGVLVSAIFAERLLSGDASALRAMQRLPLTKLYREGYLKFNAREFPGIIWSEVPAGVRVPLVHSGRAPPKAWMPDYVSMEHLKPSKKDLRDVWKSCTGRSSERDYNVKISSRGVKVTALKPNPKVDLVVVNRFDRAALLKLVGELDLDSNVEAWIAACASRGGKSQFKILFDDYLAWCKGGKQAASGSKSFAMALVALGVQKLERRGAGSYYALELRPGTGRRIAKV